jgi:hypothetical protein
MAVKLGLGSDVANIVERLSVLDADGDLNREQLRALLYELDAIELRVKDLVYVVESYLDLKEVV